MGPRDFEILRDCLSSRVVDCPEQGWEELTDAAMTHLLRTALARNTKESSTVAAPLAIPTDTRKVKVREDAPTWGDEISLVPELPACVFNLLLQKHIALVCERLAKGMRLFKEPSQAGL